MIWCTCQRHVYVNSSDKHYRIHHVCPGAVQVVAVPQKLVFESDLPRNCFCVRLPKQIIFAPILSSTDMERQFPEEDAITNAYDKSKINNYAFE